MTLQFEAPIYVRAYTAIPNKDPIAMHWTKHDRHGGPAWQIIFDTETTTDAAQKLRFGVVQVRKNGELKAEHIFVVDDLDEADLRVVSDHSVESDLNVISIDEFRREIFLKIGYRANAEIIGFNLPFDIARIALRCSEARGAMYGGFSFKLSEWKSEPAVRVKHLNASAALIDFAKPGKQLVSRGMRKRGIEPEHNRGHFIDVKTAASSLLTGRYSLDSLCKRLGVATQKLETDQHGERLTHDYIDYARADVQATWECYQRLASIYAEYGLATPLSKILSEASLGKALLRGMNINPLLQGGVSDD